MLPGMIALSGRREPFASFEVSSNETWVVPAGVSRVRIDGRAASAVGTWVAVAVRLMRMQRSISSTGTDGALNRNWSDWFGKAPLLTEYQKFMAVGSGGTNGQPISYNYRSSNFVQTYLNNTSTAPRRSSTTSLSAVLDSNRTRRYRNCSVPNPTNMGSDVLDPNIAYTNWGGTNADFNVDAEEYQYLGRGGTQSVVGSASGALQSLSDQATFIPEGAAVSVFPPTGAAVPTLSQTYNVTPGETLTFAFSATGNGRRFTVIDAG